MNHDALQKAFRGLWVAGCLLLSLAPPLSCGLTAPSPAAPPAPPAEIPAALTFPGSVNVGFGTPSEEASLKLAATPVPIGGEFFEAIQFGFDVNDKANGQLEAILSGLSGLEIPLNPVTRTFEKEFDGDGGFLGDAIKIDFGDFAFPGKPEACTGCTCPTGCDTACPTEAAEEDLRPVCYRIWRDAAFDGESEFIPLIGGFMTRLPVRDDPATPEDETNSGNGSFSILAEDPLLKVTSGSVYRHRDIARPFDKRTEFFQVVIDKPSETSEGAATINLVTTAQIGLEGAASSDQVIKSLKHAVAVESPLGVPDDRNLQYLAQFREDDDFWSGTLQNNLEFIPFAALSTPPETTDNFTGECVDLFTAVGVDEGTCEDLGIDVTDVPFLEIPLSSDPSVNFPADFPSLPTFE
jgi:hypothetical protein